MRNKLDSVFEKGDISPRMFLHIFDDYPVLISDTSRLVMVKLSGDHFYDATPDSFIELRGALGDHYNGVDQQVIHTAFDVVINLKGHDPVKVNRMCGEPIHNLFMLQLVDYLSNSGEVYTYSGECDIVELDTDHMYEHLLNIRRELFSKEF
jgi:hypothetical protein